MAAQKFQYKTINIAKGEVQVVLEGEGKMGWQVVAVDGRSYLLMREMITIPVYPPQQVHKSILAPEDNCVLCRIRPWTRRIKNDYVDGGYGYVCESCYPKTQPAGPGQPTYSLGVCSICRAEAKMAYVNALGTITSMCWKCEGDNRNNTIVFKHTHIIEKLEEPRVKVNWRGTCTCGYSCVTDESRGWVENCLAKHKHLG